MIFIILEDKLNQFDNYIDDYRKIVYYIIGIIYVKIKNDRHSIYSFAIEN